MSKTKLKKLQKLEVRLLCLVNHQSFFLPLVYYCGADSHWSQEEKRKKLLQAESIEILQYATLNLFFTQ